MSQPAMPERRRDLMRRRLFELEREAFELYAELSKLHVNDRLPGTYLVVESGGFGAVIPASAVCEIVRLVECTPLPSVPSFVRGTFIYRGTVVLAVDLSRYLGAPQELQMDAHMIVLAASRPTALCVDRVRTLVESPVIAEGSADGEGEAGAGGVGKLTVGLCTVDGKVLPIVGLAPLLASLEGLSP
ncbi:MAG: chemotaxis protein CheW [Myxococcaceae bacterium]